MPGVRQHASVNDASAPLLAALVLASVVALVLLSSGGVIPSVARNPLSDFVQPGVTVWWLVLGGPFRVAPSSVGGIALAAVTNAVLWLAAIWFVVALYGLIQRRLSTR